MRDLPLGGVDPGFDACCLDGLLRGRVGPPLGELTPAMTLAVFLVGGWSLFGESCPPLVELLAYPGSSD